MCYDICHAPEILIKYIYIFFEITKTYLQLRKCYTAAENDTVRYVKLRMKYLHTFLEEYPNFKREKFIEDFHGTKIPDPYRWLEDPESPDTKDFVNQQNDIFKKYQSSMNHRTDLLQSLKETYNFPTYGCPKKHGKYYYYNHNPGLLNQSIIYRQVFRYSQIVYKFLFRTPLPRTVRNF